MTLLRKTMLCLVLAISGFSVAPMAVADAGSGLPYGPDTCKNGYVWRGAASFDHVCVVPSSRTRAAHENSIAQLRIAPGGGAYGPDTCKNGYVWREAFANDDVCVTPTRRTAVAEENALGPSRRVL